MEAGKESFDGGFWSFPCRDSRRLSCWTGDGAAQCTSASGEVVATLPTGDGPTGLDVTEAGLWVANNLDGTVSLIDQG